MKKLILIATVAIFSITACKQKTDNGTLDESDMMENDSATMNRNDAMMQNDSTTMQNDSMTMKNEGPKMTPQE